MDKDKKIPPNKEEFVAVPNHTEKIQSQVLAKIGRPLRFDHVEVSVCMQLGSFLDIRCAVFSKFLIQVFHEMKHVFPEERHRWTQ
jgi:hypothetical protein